MSFPETWTPPLVRTSFDAPEPWDTVLAIIAPPEPDDDQFLAAFDVVPGRRYAGRATADVVAEALADGVGERHPLLFVVDDRTLAGPDWPIAAVDLRVEPGRLLRSAAHELWGVENNVSTANMDFHEFADRAAQEPDGVFRGFSEI